MIIVTRKSDRRKGWYIGRPSTFGNPFCIGRDGNRTEVIEKYRQYLWRKFKEGNSPIWAGIEKMAEAHLAGEDVVLKCFCAPKPCHGDILKRAIEWLAKEGR